MKPWSLLSCACLLVVSVWAQQAAVKNSTTAGKPIGVLIGLGVSQQNDQPVSAGQNDADSDTKSETAAPNTPPSNEMKIIHHTTSEADSPYQTVWILKSADGVRVRLLQDIIVPRKSGFWRLGANTDSAKAEYGAAFMTAEVDFFWATPLGTKPKLTEASDDDLGCVEQTVSKELQYAGPDYVGYAEFWSATCAHYDEGHSYGVARLDDLKGKPVGLDDLLGPQAAQQHQRLNQLAKRWGNEDCGASGFSSEADNWTLKHSQGVWHAVAKFNGSGGGICGRFDEDRTIQVPLPKSLVVNNVLPVTWKQILAAFPNATDAFAAPAAELLVVFTDKAILLVPIQGQTLGKPIYSADVPQPKPVMAEWALGANALRWDHELSALPAPNVKDNAAVQQ